MIRINTYLEEDLDEIISLVLHCQNDGTRPLKTIEDQPDILNIKEHYMKNKGNFWTAKDNNKLAGTIGLVVYDNGISILKKFFVYEQYRGKPHNLGQRLYQTLLDYAVKNGVREIILDTPKNTNRAHKFYVKAGFEQVKKEDLPISYDYPYSDSDFFILKLPVKI